MAEIKLYGTLVPNDKQDPDGPTHLAEFGKGGYRSVLDIAARDSIPNVFKEDGMIVYVQQEGKTYQLRSDIWYEFGIGGSGGSSNITYGEYNNKPALLDNGSPLVVFDGISGIMFEYQDGILTGKIDPDFVIDEGEII